MLKTNTGTSLGVQWLILSSNVEGGGVFPDQGAKIAHASAKKDQEM